MESKSTSTAEYSYVSIYTYMNGAMCVYIIYQFNSYLFLFHDFFNANLAGGRVIMT